MSWDAYDKNCLGCRPALVDSRTGRVYPDDSPEMQAISLIWSAATDAELRAYHQVCCRNSRDPEVLRIAGGLVGRVKQVLPRG